MNLQTLRKQIEKTKTIPEKARLLAKYTGNYDDKKLLDTFSTSRNRAKLYEKIRLYRVEDEIKKANEIVQKQYLNLITKTKKRISFKRFKLLKEKADRLLDYLDDGYGMGSEKSLYVDGYKFAYKDETIEYSSNYKYKARHGIITLYMSLNELSKIEYKDGNWKIEGAKSKILEISGKYAKFYAELKEV